MVDLPLFWIPVLFLLWSVGFMLGVTIGYHSDWPTFFSFAA